jgi:SHS2 domain-containing protein
MAGERGHRAVEHTADVILEAWGPDPAACLEEAVAALVETYADVRTGATAGEHRLHLGPASPDALLLGILDEVIFTLDVAEGIPVGAEVAIAGDGGLDVVLHLAHRDGVEGTGSVPKAVSRSELVVEERPGHTRCRFLVDV